MIFENRDESGGGMLFKSFPNPECIYVGVSSKQGEEVAWKIFDNVTVDLTKSGNFIEAEDENCYG